MAACTCPDPGANPVNFELCTISDNVEMTDYQICKVRFRVLAGWEGDTAQVNFITNNCSIMVPGCLALSGPYNYHGGVVTVTPYHVELKTEWDPTSGLLSKSVTPQYAYFWGQIKNDFSTGPFNGAIRVNYRMDANWPFLDVQTCPDCYTDLNFSINTYDDTATIYQTNTTNWVPAQTDFVNIMRIRALFETGAFAPKNYGDRYVPLLMDESFVSGGVTYNTQVEDYTGTVTATVANGRLAFAGNGLAEVKIGELHVAYITTHIARLYIKWNFPEAINSFSVNANLASSFYYTNFVPAPAFTGMISVENLPSAVYRIYSNGNFTGINNPGGTYVELGTIYYDYTCPVRYSVGKLNFNAEKPCGPYTVGGSLVLTAPIIAGGGMDQYAVSDTTNVYHGCNSCPQPPAEQNPVLKDQQAGLPKEYKLNQNHPNPFNPTTSISYDVPAPSRVKIVVMNILGQTVATLVDESKAAGSYEISWNGTDHYGNQVSSGVYLCIMRAGDYSSSIKMSLMK